MKKELCDGYKTSLKTALDHTRLIFAEMDGCDPEDVEPFHPSEIELEIEQKDLFDEIL